MSVLRVGADPFPPYQYIDEEGNLSGSDYETICKVIQKMGYSADVILREWSDVEELMDAGEIDLAFQVQKTEERLSKWHFSDKLRDSTTVIISLDADSKVSVNCLADSGEKIGVIRGYKYGDFIDSLDEHNKLACKSLEEILDCILGGRIKYGVADLGVFQYMQKGNSQYSKIKIVKDTSFNRPLYVVFNDSKICSQFNVALKTLK